MRPVLLDGLELAQDARRAAHLPAAAAARPAPQWGNYAEVCEPRPVRALDRQHRHRRPSLATLGAVARRRRWSPTAFARFRYPGRDLFFMLTLATLMLPAEVTLDPAATCSSSKLGWLDTFWPLIVPSWFGGGAFYIFLLRQFFMTIPRDLDEAARIDGASSLRIFWRRSCCRSATPALATVAIFSFIAPLERLPRPADLPEHARAVHALARPALLPDTRQAEAACRRSTC